VLLVEGHAVDAVVAIVGFGAELAADSHLGGQTHDADADLVCDKGGNGLVNVAGV